MIIVCQSCATRLQVDEDKSPTRPFNVRCPKCNTTVSSDAPHVPSDQGALAVGESPSTEHKRYEPSTAPAFQLNTATSETGNDSSEDAIRTLLTLLNKGVNSKVDNPGARPSWDCRKVLACASEPHRELVARRLTESGYQVYVASDTRQAVETMRSNQLDIVLLDSQFDPAEQGSVFVVREVNVLRPAQRRRLFFVLVSPALRTMDTHSAFLNNVNSVVNINDLEDLPRILDVALREYNELYREFNGAFNLANL
jgi:predicted Zn finger-like uncharacterized protein